MGKCRIHIEPVIRGQWQQGRKQMEGKRERRQERKKAREKEGKRERNKLKKSILALHHLNPVPPVLLPHPSIY
jgi:hypothetical protein